MRRLVLPLVPGRYYNATLAKVMEAGVNVDVRLLAESDAEAYPRLLRRLWQRQEPFAICEQDMWPEPDDLLGLLDCPEDWCTVHYRLIGGLTTDMGLGLAGFGLDLLLRDPGAVERVFARWQLQGRPPHWRRLDVGLGHVLTARGLKPHVHDCWVRHLSIEPF